MQSACKLAIGFRVWGLGFRALKLECVGFRVWCFGFIMSGTFVQKLLASINQGFRLRVYRV